MAQLWIVASVFLASNALAQLDWSTATFIPKNSAEVGVGDFNKDDAVDIAIAGSEQRWYAGPEFTTSYKLGESRGGPYAAQVADINNDGWLDFVTSDGARTAADIPGHLYVYLNPGATGPVTEEWSRITVYTGNVRHQNDLRIADMDGDGRLDIIERTWSSERVVVAMQNSNINNWTVRVFDTGETGTPEGISAGDIDGDEEMEIVLSGVYWDNPGGWRTGDPVEYGIDTQFVGATYGKVKSAVGDINKDGRNDVYMGSAEGSNRYLAWYENTGNTTSEGGVEWIRHIIKNNFGKAHMVQLIDIDQDDDLDLVTGQSFGQKGLLVFYNNNAGQSWTEQNYDPTGEIYTGVVADLDGDNDLDVVGPSKFYGGQVRYYINESDVVPVTPLAVEPAVLTLAASGQGQSVSVITEAAWTSSSDQPWLTVSPESATGNTSITVAASAFNLIGNRNGSITIDNGEITRTITVIQMGLPDIAAPTVPASLVISDVRYDRFDLSWTPSTDNSGSVAEYIVYLNAGEKTRVATNSVVVTGLTSLGSYSVTVVAVDVAGNASAPSSPVLVDTPQAPPSPPPLFYWKLDESTGTTAADSTGGNPGQLNTPGSPVWTSGQFDNGLSFDGGNDKVDLGTLDIPLSSPSAMTISGWVRPGDLANYPEGRIISKASGSSASDHYWMLSTIQSGSSYVPRARLKISGTTVTLVGSTTAPVTNDSWFHIVATYDGSALRLYNNGSEVGAINQSGSISMAPSVGAAIGNQPAGDRGFAGLLDDICVFNFALSPEQISGLYNQGVGRACDAVPTGGQTDTTAPFITEFAAIASPTTDTTPAFTLASSEAGQVTFSGDCAATPDQPVDAGNTAISLSVLAAGDYSNCRVQVSDAADNASNLLILSPFTIALPDLTSPSATINQDPAQADPTSSNIARFILEFSEPIDVTTLSSSDIVLSGTGGRLATDPVAISDDDRRFSFQVTGMTSGDVVSANLPAERVSDLAGNANLAATFNDNQVAYHCDNCGIVDQDGDGIEDSEDNCPERPNPQQLPEQSCRGDQPLCFPIVTNSGPTAMICL